MFCSQCGSKIIPGARFCAGCGATQAAQDQEAVSATAVPDVPVTSSSDGAAPLAAGATAPSSGSVSAAAVSGGGERVAAGVSAPGIFFKTIPYVFMRILVYLLFGLALITFLGLMGGIGYLIVRMFKEAGLPLTVVGLTAIIGAWSLKTLAQRYFLYLVKIAHVAVITEIVIKGNLPAGTNQVAYGKEKVLKHFGSASALFLADRLVDGTVRQVLNWLTRLAGCLGDVPGLSLLIKLMRRILSLAANYIDESVMSYILIHDEENVYQSACDGVVLYAQSWRRLLGTATRCVILVALIWGVAFLVMLFPLLGAVRTLVQDPALRLLYGFIALFIAFVAANTIKWAVADPMCTVAMVARYNRAIVGQMPAHDLRSTLSSISGKFRQLAQKAAAPASQTASQSSRRVESI